MSYGTPDSAVMECITMVIVIMKNPKSSIYSGGAGAQSSQQRQNLGGNSPNRIQASPNQQLVTPKESRKQVIYRWSVTIWFAFLLLNISIANFVTGLQSIDQIFFGLGIGVWTGYFCDSFMRKPLDRHVTKLLNGEYHV